MAAVTRSAKYTPRLVDRLRTLWQRITQRNTQTITLTDNDTLELPAPMSGLLGQAVHENSNRELDWLWYAAHLDSAAEQRYCLGRARYINPHSEHIRASRTWF